MRTVRQFSDVNATIDFINKTKEQYDATQVYMDSTLH